MGLRGRALESGTAFVNKGEPSATDMAHLRLRLDPDQKTKLQVIVARGIQGGFMSGKFPDTES